MRAVLLSCLVAAGCVDVGTAFKCSSSSQCGAGHCEATGFCSFDDSGCASGRRYGELVGDGLAGLCVLEGGGGDLAGAASSDLAAAGGSDLSGNLPQDLAGATYDLARPLDIMFTGPPDIMFTGPPDFMFMGPPDMMFMGPPDMMFSPGDLGAACFVAGTPITMADGTTRPIERVKVGDLVLSYDVEGRRTLAARVERTFIHDSSLPIVVINGALRATANHPMYANGRWVPSGALEPHDVLLGARDAERIPITSLALEPPAARVYNLDVAGGRGFFTAGLLAGTKGGL